MKREREPIESLVITYRGYSGKILQQVKVRTTFSKAERLAYMGHGFKRTKEQPGWFSRAVTIDASVEPKDA